jgi:NTP pyrophosphatase (non-canonical NTP hydrolase)
MIAREYLNELIRTLRLIGDTPAHYFYNKLSEETGEVAEVASALMGSERKCKKILKKHNSLEDALLEELGDTVNVVMIIASQHGLKPEDVIDMGRIKMKRKNDKRDK